ncbi:hypothetical protein GL325_06945 [Aeromicrobium sp. 636]|uniref:DUF4430 domain-containing protein n=1 Tax=Aeromicrobium senzhongii TaxID=2663859 RepID=A0A8I0ETS2_9ACTN|nr:MULTISPECIES: hypothetical protein [Aeromicrobium]MBC9226050.1 hypothetical protein [Aeromicrobium senzhongii]MCQ3998157.1 hypothetical protein [Aeromicrobium sp. 636]MTB88585.1 hypothetical protein [Aeromicrobium senzhongii]QNL94103.1 hypothetical protein H9L21_13595 [Aeromicrobium senzhongii]
MKSWFARLAALLLLAAAVAVVPTAATAHESCESDEDVPIVLEFGALDGKDRILCAQHAAGQTGLKALTDAGVEVQDTAGSPPMVCRIDGQPTPAQEKCGNALNGPGYWAFMVAKEGQDWDYASVGLQEYELAAGDFVALKYQQMSDGEKVEVNAAADAQTREAAVVADHGEKASDESPTAVTTVLPIAIGAVFLVAVAAFVVARRRRP